MTREIDTSLRYVPIDAKTWLVRLWFGDSAGVVEELPAGKFKAMRFHVEIGIYDTLEEAGAALEQADKDDPVIR